MELIRRFLVAVGLLKPRKYLTERARVEALGRFWCESSDWVTTLARKLWRIQDERRDVRHAAYRKHGGTYPFTQMEEVDQPYYVVVRGSDALCAIGAMHGETARLSRDQWADQDDLENIPRKPALEVVK